LPTLWTPSSIASDIRVWGKADVGATVNANGRVNSLADQSGNGKTMTSPTSTKVSPYDTSSPLYTTALQNGLPGFGNDTGFGLTRCLQTAANPFTAAFTQGTPFSVAVAFKRNVINYLTEALFDQMVNHNTYYYQGWGLFLGRYYGQGRASLWIGNTFNGTSSSQILVRGATTLQTNTNYVLVINYTGSGAASGVSMYLNGVADPTTIVDDSLATGTVGAQSTFQPTYTSGLVSTTAPLSIGDSWNPASANGDILFEFLLFDRPLTVNESQLTCTYLNQRWAIY
jgi:hypothetical protein